MIELLKRSFKPNFSAIVVAALVVGLVGSAVSVAYSVHHARLKLQDLQRLDEEKNRLDVEWGQLLLEQHAWGSYGRIGKLGAEELQMIPPPPQTVVMVQQ
ncbi:cell division protein FtsL [Fluviicoccus keumensis]|uniref:Cell division protein FtsL n=1 Tax=Fluviicoccus keumensis TaxID=1435465 RepID=A0A4Q7YEG1_9GAMM|nr:cell division protein FtsL [Fluviicoccus keumensis]RZU35368.1 cell division protein FtsL [Fluviicoccus keumensis]